MTADGRPLFRPEAVAHHASGRTAPRSLDLGERRTSWLFRLLLLLVAAALVTAFTVHTDLTTNGRVRVLRAGRTVTVLVPPGAAPRLRPGQPVRLNLQGGKAHGTVTDVGAPVTSGDSLAVPVTVAVDRDVRVGDAGTAVVRLARHTLAHLLLGRG